VSTIGLTSAPKGSTPAVLTVAWGRGWRRGGGRGRRRQRGGRRTTSRRDDVGWAASGRAAGTAYVEDDARVGGDGVEDVARAPYGVEAGMTTSSTSARGRGRRSRARRDVADLMTAPLGGEGGAAGRGGRCDDGVGESGERERRWGGHAVHRSCAGCGAAEWRRRRERAAPDWD
jgi:hypothetical protein